LHGNFVAASDTPFAMTAGQRRAGNAGRERHDGCRQPVQGQRQSRRDHR
jgi:hypothetical protein